MQQDCFSVSAPNDHIYIPVDHHSIKLSEPLDSNGLLKAIGSSAGMLDDSMRGTDATPANGQAIITSDENDTVLMTFNGDYTIENVCFDCRNVRLGIRCRRGTVTLKNCRLIDNSKSSTNNGISIAGRILLNILKEISELHRGRLKKTTKMLYFLFVNRWRQSHIGKFQHREFR